MKDRLSLLNQGFEDKSNQQVALLQKIIKDGLEFLP